MCEMGASRYRSASMEAGIYLWPTALHSHRGIEPFSDPGMKGNTEKALGKGSGCILVKAWRVLAVGVKKDVFYLPHSCYPNLFYDDKFQCAK